MEVIEIGDSEKTTKKTDEGMSPVFVWIELIFLTINILLATSLFIGDGEKSSENTDAGMFLFNLI